MRSPNGVTGSPAPADSMMRLALTPPDDLRFRQMQKRLAGWRQAFRQNHSRERGSDRVAGTSLEWLLGTIQLRDRSSPVRMEPISGTIGSLAFQQVKCDCNHRAILCMRYTKCSLETDCGGRLRLRQTGCWTVAGRLSRRGRIHADRNHADEAILDAIFGERS
jgi:hypothetical protein